MRHVVSHIARSSRFACLRAARPLAVAPLCLVLLVLLAAAQLVPDSPQWLAPSAQAALIFLCV